MCKRIVGIACFSTLLVSGTVLSQTSTASAEASSLTIAQLRCEHTSNPLGIETRHPRLSWVLESKVRGQKQMAYQILVATTPEKLSEQAADLWNSAKVSSDRNVHVVYQGKPVQSRTRCWWKVRVWDTHGEPTDWSAPAWWEMALLKPADWQAKWIGLGVPERNTSAVKRFPSPHFRKTIDLSKPVKSARAYICGLGFYELSINGTKVGDDVLNPNYTDYSRRGTKLYLRFVEKKTLDFGQADSYVLKGDGVEQWEPRFTWHGFRYVDVRGFTEPLTVENITARVVHTAVDRVGSFECSNPLFNQLSEHFRWSQLSNMHCGVQSDCPHRERRGYPCEMHIPALSAIYNFDMARFYAKRLNDFKDAQNTETGFICATAPYDDGGGGPAEASVYIELPWFMYLYYGDERTLAEHYAGMKHWIAYLGTIIQITPDGELITDDEIRWDNLPEWGIPQKPKFTMEITPGYVASCYYIYCSRLLSRIATILDEEKDAAFYQSLAERVNNAFQARYYKPDLHQYSIGKEGTNVFALALGLCAQENRQAVLERLVDHIRIDHKEHFHTGQRATPLLLDLLSESGEVDLAYTLMNQRTRPSFGAHVNLGATSIWETWRGGSQLHSAKGGFARWFYLGLAGIYPDPEYPAFKNIVINPHPAKELTYAKAEYNSIRGRIKIAWTKDADTFRLSISVPANSTATVHLPGRAGSRITEGTTPIEATNGVRFLRAQSDRMVYQVESGEYEFEVHR